MASFFRKRIAQRVLSMLQRRQELKMSPTPNLVSSFVKVNKFKSTQPELVISWNKIEQICDQALTMSPKEFVRLLKNQGLPTAEGFIDITLSESPLNLIFTVDKHIFSKIVLVDICTNEDDFAKNSCLFEDIEKKNVVVQCSAPSVGENFDLSHFHTVIHTNFVANINEFAGHKVTRIAHVNDWGLHAAMFLTGYKEFKCKRIVPKKESFYLSGILKAAQLQYRNDMKFKMNADLCYQKLQHGDVSVISEWQELKQMCMKHYESIYKRLNIQFDAVHFDSTCFKKSQKISNYLLENNFFDKSFVTNNYELQNNKFINDVTDRDSALYEVSRYMSAATHLKDTYNSDEMFYVSPSSSHNDFFGALFYMLKKLNNEWTNELHHIDLKMKTNLVSKRQRKVDIDTMLNQVKSGMILKLQEDIQHELNESIEEMAEKLSVSSLIVDGMKRKRKVDYIFDWQDIISFKKDTGASFVLCSAGLKGLQEDSEYIFQYDIDLSPLLEQEAHYLIQHLARFDEIVFKSYISLEPCIIFKYISSLWYFTDNVTNKIKLDIKTNRLREIKARLLLLSATLKVLNKALHIMGITPLDKIPSEEASVQKSL